MSQPAGDWFAEAYDPKGWKQGKAAFGTEDNPNCSTPWSTGDIWVRRTFDWPSDARKDALYLQYSHDDNIEVYLNGKQIAVAGNGLDYDLLKEIPEAVAESLKPTGNVSGRSLPEQWGRRLCGYGNHAEGETRRYVR